MLIAALIVGVLAALIALDGALFYRRRRAHVSIRTPGLERAFLCADCTGPLVAHAPWCGRGERPAGERDRREVRGAARGKAAA